MIKITEYNSTENPPENPRKIRIRTFLQKFPWILPFADISSPDYDNLNVKILLSIRVRVGVTVRVRVRNMLVSFLVEVLVAKGFVREG